MIRRFKIINAQGLEWDLMRRDAFLYAPEGLGISAENEYMRVGSAYELTQQISAQRQVTGTMVFASYSVYRDFARFIIETPLKLAYMPDGEWGYIDGSITSLEKAEFNPQTRRLECGAVFTATSLWYIPREAQKTAPETQSPKKYNYTYDYQYADELNGYIRVVNDAAQDSPAIISIMGPIANPIWRVSVNNNIIASGSVLATIPAGHKLVINSKDGELEVAEYIAATNEFVRDRYQETDFSRETFIFFPPGNSVLYVSGTNPDTIDAWVEVAQIHETI